MLMSMKDAIEEEVRLTRTPEDFKKWKDNDLPAQANGLTVCYDMGRNKCSSGNRYDSALYMELPLGLNRINFYVFDLSQKNIAFVIIRKKKMVRKKLRNISVQKIICGRVSQWNPKLFCG